MPMFSHNTCLQSHSKKKYAELPHLYIESSMSIIKYVKCIHLCVQLHAYFENITINQHSEINRD